MKIIELRSENIKMLKAVTIRPTSDIVTILGENGAGKSSTLDSILYAFGGKGALPAEPVRSGTEKASISLGLGTDQVELTIERIVHPDRRTTVKVIDDRGAHYPNPESMLKSLFGEFAFEPETFVSSEPKKKLEILRRIVKLDVDVDDLDRLNELDYMTRRDWNAKIESLKTRFTDLQAELSPTMDVTPVDVDALTKAMSDASEQNLAFTTQRHELAQLVDAKAKLLEKAENYRRQAEELIRQAEGFEAKAAGVGERIVAMPEIPPNIELTELRSQVNDAMRINAERKHQMDVRANYERVSADLAAAQAKSQSLTDAMSARLQQKKDAIANAKMPIEGLGFGKDGVVYKGFPLEQVSEAERWRVAIAIAIALNPRVRVVLIRNASLLSKKSLALVAEVAAEFDCQVWLERVGDGPCGILIEDGEVTQIDGVPVNAPETETTAVGA